MKFVVVYLEYDNHQEKMVNSKVHLRPYDDAIGWANGILQTNIDRRGIVVSHHIVSPFNTFEWDDDKTGQRIFDGLTNNSNLFLMLSGHVRNMPGEFRVLDAPAVI